MREYKRIDSLVGLCGGMSSTMVLLLHHSVQDHPSISDDVLDEP